MKIHYLSNYDATQKITDAVFVNWNIHSWMPSFKMPAYDVDFSLGMLLSGDTYDSVRATPTPPFDGDIYASESERLRRKALALTIQDADPEEILHCIGEYLAMRTASIFTWDYNKSDSINKHAVFDFLVMCSIDKHKKLANLYDPDIFTAFAITQLRHNIFLSDMIEAMFEPFYGKKRYKNEALDNFVSTYGIERVYTIIGKVIESGYRVDNFSTARFLLKRSTYKIFDDSKLRYNISELTQVDANIYLPDNAAVFMTDISSINAIIDSARLLCDDIPATHIARGDLVFSCDRTRKRNYCYFTYKANTATGKLQKHPLSLDFFAKIPEFACNVLINMDYNQKFMFSRGKITITHDGNKFRIFLSDKFGELAITQIDWRIVTGYNKTVYKLENKK